VLDHLGRDGSVEELALCIEDSCRTICQRLLVEGDVGITGTGYRNALGVDLKACNVSVAGTLQDAAQLPVP
jgi:hypothetical protein